MNSLILKIAVRILYPLMVLVSLLIMLRGHHLPGGGFIGGLIAASALIFKTFVEGIENTERNMLVKPYIMIIAGLCIAAAAAVLPLFTGMDFFFNGSVYKIITVGGWMFVFWVLM